MDAIKIMGTALLSVVALFVITKIMGLDADWLTKRLRSQGHTDAKEIFLGFYRIEEDKLTLYTDE